MLSTRSRMIVLSLMLLAAMPAVAESVSSAAPVTSVVASQGDASVTLADLDAFAERIPIDKRAGFFNSPARIDGLITNLLVQKQLANEARKAGIQPDPEASGQVVPATDDVLAKARMQRFRTDLKIPDFNELAREQYLGHKEDFITAGKLTVKHVLISTKSRTEAEARSLADTVEKEAIAHPDQFDALIEKYSDDPDKATGHGVLEKVGEKGKYVAEFANAAKALAKPGDVSPVVKVPLGLHVIQLVERSPDQQASFDEVKAEILARINKEFVEKAVRGYTDELRNKPMNADPALVASLRSRYGATPAIPGQEAATGK